MLRTETKKVKGTLFAHTERSAVRLSHQPGMHVKTVAAALGIHLLMLSKWRKNVRDGIIRGRAVTAPPPGPAREIAQLKALVQRDAELQQNREFLQ
jgi:transposase